MEASWTVLGRLGGVLGRLGGVLGLFWRRLGSLWGSKKACKTNQKSPFLRLVPTWSHLVPMWFPFGPHQVVLVSWRRLDGVFEASWGRLGGDLGNFGCVLGASWGALTSLGFPKKLVKPVKSQYFCFWSTGGGPKKLVKLMKNQHVCFRSPLGSF